MSRPNAVALVVRCNQCNTEVQIVISKKELKLLLKGFKLPMKEATRYVETEYTKTRRYEK